MDLDEQMNSRITIVDVAKQAGVSFGTVSRVINNDVHVKKETRERVVETMERLGFVANRQARSLAGGKSNSIGVLVPDLGTGYIGEIIRGIDAELSLTDLDLILYTTHRTASKETNYVTNLATGMVDGLLLVLPRSPADFIGNLTQSKFPFVLIDHQGAGCNHVCGWNYGIAPGFVWPRNVGTGSAQQKYRADRQHVEKKLREDHVVEQIRVRPADCQHGGPDTLDCQREGRDAGDIQAARG